MRSDSNKMRWLVVILICAVNSVLAENGTDDTGKNKGEFSLPFSTDFQLSAVGNKS